MSERAATYFYSLTQTIFTCAKNYDANRTLFTQIFGNLPQMDGEKIKERKQENMHKHCNHVHIMLTYLLIIWSTFKNSDMRVAIHQTRNSLCEFVRRKYGNEKVYRSYRSFYGLFRRFFLLSAFLICDMFSPYKLTQCQVICQRSLPCIGKVPSCVFTLCQNHYHDIIHVLPRFHTLVISHQ